MCYTQTWELVIPSLENMATWSQRDWWTQQQTFTMMAKAVNGNTWYQRAFECPPHICVGSLWVLWAPLAFRRYVCRWIGYLKLTLSVNVCYNSPEMSWQIVQVGPCLQKMDGWPKRRGGGALKHYGTYHLEREQRTFSFGGLIEPKLMCLHCWFNIDIDVILVLKSTTSITFQPFSYLFINTGKISS